MPVKIESIHAVGRFKDYTAKGNTTFRDLVALYSPNGNGKSTLGDIFRSLQSNEADIIHGRHTLNSATPSKIVIRLQDKKQARFNGKQWNRPCPEISIFDETFIEETIHSGNVVEAHQRKRLHQVVIGKESVAIQTKMDAIDRINKKLSGKIIDAQDDMEAHFPGLLEKTVLDIPLIEDIDNKIKELNIVIENLKQIDDIQEAQLPEQIVALTSPCDTASCLSVKLSDLVAQAREKVQTHLDSSKMDDKGERWIQKGMKWSDNGKCPFCGQALDNSPIFDLFETYFDDEYNQLMAKLDHIKNDTQISFGDKTIHRIQLGVSNNEKVMGFWAKLIKTTLPEIDVDKAITPAVLKTSTGLMDLLEAKAKNPINEIKIASDAEWISELQTACETIQGYNDLVAKACGEIELLRKSLEEGNLGAAKMELQSLMLSKQRHTPEVAAVCSRFVRYTAAKKKLTAQKAKLRKSLNKLSATILKKHGANINLYLRQFGTAFKIENLDTAHASGKPSTNFEILINGCSVKTTGSTKGSPHFGNTLSTGDKRALAFAFFLSMVNQDPEISDKLIIFDDPFSSLDSFRRSRTKDRILELVGKARVVIVMSHDRDFLWHVTEKAGKQKIALKIVNKKGTSVIEEWDIDADTLDQYEKDILQLRTYNSGENDNDHLAVARSLRPSLEGMFRREFAEMFGKNDWLKNMIDEVKNADADDKIYRFTPVVSELEDIKEYTNPFHHSDVKKDGISIDPEELRSYCTSVLYVLDGDFEKAEV